MNFSKQIKFLNWLFICVFAVTFEAQAEIDQGHMTNAKALAHYVMGHMYDLIDEPGLAVLEYESAAQLDKDASRVHLRLGIDYARTEMIPEAVSSFKLVGQLNPDDLQSHYLLAAIYTAQKEYDKAAEEYEFILKSLAEAEPENTEVYGFLAQLYYSQRKFPQAIEQYAKILTLEPQNADVMYMLGSLYLEVGHIF